ncbi:ATP-dependent DNA helicase 2 subunit KU70 [Zea mays]|uniref:Arp2/3 complex 34 kDa subunit n=3 Tax=Zea mays TaxID=4577 RepID=A0A3L6FTT5_MAIZE|nr:ATP-dependent DNA helicase 2 subunit KU70 [Zea mays]
MDLDPEGIFRDDSDEDEDSVQEREANKEMVVYLVNASPKMFTPATTQDNEKQETHFHTIVNCITESLKTQIIGRSYDEVAICFFNTKEKKNLQDSAGVYVYNVGDREQLDRPTAKLIKDFSLIEDSFMSTIGSRYGITAGSRENTLYNALWVAQALLRKGSVKTVSKRILIFTNEDDPFGTITGADAQDLGLSIELLPLSPPDDQFNMSLFYADLIGLDGDEMTEYLPSAGDNTIVKFSVRELSEVKRVASHHLRLIGFKPLDCLKDYHNLRPSTFIYPSDERIFGSTCVFVALHSSMLRLGSSFESCNSNTHSKTYHITTLCLARSQGTLRWARFALAFYGNPTRPQLIALVAQEEVTSSGRQFEPPGMHMIYLPYSDDIRYPEEVHVTSDDAPRATDEQIKKASNIFKRIDLINFSACQFANPALQRHYGILEALALGEDEMPDIKDETLPDEEGLSKPGVANAIEEFKTSVYGENYDQEEAEAAAGKASRGNASKKRKELKEMTTVELRSYLTAHDLPVSGKKEILQDRVLSGEKGMDIDCHTVEFDDVRYHIQFSMRNPKVMVLSVALPLPPPEAILYDGLPLGAIEAIKAAYGPVVQILDPPKDGFDLTMKINLTKLPLDEEQRNTILTQIASIREVVLGAPLKLLLKHLASKTVAPNVNNLVALVHRPNESFFLAPQADKVTIVYPMRFQDSIDIVLATSFLQEFVEARRTAALNNVPSCMWSPVPPLELKGVSADALNANAGFVTFVVYPRHVEGKKLDRTVWNLLTFHAYVSYHVKCSEGFMHTRMRRRVESLIQALDRAKSDAEKLKKLVHGGSFKRLSLKNEGDSRF